MSGKGKWEESEFYDEERKYDGDAVYPRKLEGLEGREV